MPLEPDAVVPPVPDDPVMPFDPALPPPAVPVCPAPPDAPFDPLLPHPAYVRAAHTVNHRAVERIRTSSAFGAINRAILQLEPSRRIGGSAALA
jgi:hypothetical protein